METNLWLRHVSDVRVQHVLLHLVHVIVVSLTVIMYCDKKMYIAQTFNRMILSNAGNEE